MHKDLGTGERLCAAQLHHSIASTLWDYLQPIIFLPGLFYLKMRIFILLSAAYEDETFLMVHIIRKFSKLEYTDLEAFAQSKPTLSDLKVITDEMVHYFLLYKELSYAMNSGDIGCVKIYMVNWIPILKGVGKHKYTTHMMKFLIDAHFLYPPGLRHAIHYHLLVNLTGKPMKWCAVD
ncbi:hypothetical protein HD554DRAFT_2203694 [Boletus coccyginus]|nr:hypothetical protein HD554DRAFT_2203694 [Boletus coccyginus]